MLEMASDSRYHDTLPKLLTVPQLAAYLNVPVSTIYHWRHKRHGPPALRVGKRLCFRAKDVAEWLEHHKPA
jgi:excisionase family DNA binding protein